MFAYFYQHTFQDTTNYFNAALDKWQQAEKAYQLAIEIKPNDFMLFSNQGHTLSAEADALAQNNLVDEAYSKWQEAHKQYSKALIIKPNSYKVTNNWISSLIYTYHALKQNQQNQTAQAKLQEAQTLAEDFIQNYPHHAAELAYNLACVYALSNNRTDKVLEQLKLAATSSKPPSKTDIEQDKDFDGIRHSPAFQNWFKQTFPE